MALSNAEIFDITGIQLPKDACVVIIRTAWNRPIVDKMEEGCISILQKNNVPFISIEVPGTIELSFAIVDFWRSQFADKDIPAAFIALGCVIQGDTPHFDYVCSSVTQGITQLNLQLPVPVIFGVLTVLNEQQAYDRLGGSHGHKGEEAAATALQMIAMSAAFKN